MPICRFVGTAAKCRRTDCPLFGMVHPGPINRRCAFDDKPGGCRKNDCKFIHKQTDLECSTISGTRDIMNTLLRNRGSVLNRIRSRCKAMIEVSTFNQEIHFRGSNEAIEKGKTTMYHEMKKEGGDFLRLRDEIKGQTR